MVPNCVFPSAPSLMSLLLAFGVLVWWLRFLFADGLTLIGQSASRVERRGVIGVDF